MNVNKHHKTVHDKVKHPCSECDYETTQKSHLNEHMKSVHEGVKYPCSECEYEAKTKSSLNRYMKSVHEGVLSCHVITLISKVLQEYIALI